MPILAENNLLNPKGFCFQLYVLCLNIFIVAFLSKGFKSLKQTFTVIGFVSCLAKFENVYFQASIAFLFQL